MRITFLFFATLFSLSTKANIYTSTLDTTKESKKKLEYYIEICKDKMTDKEYAFGSKSLLCSSDGKKGFFLRVDWESKNGEVTYNGLTVKSAGIGTCNENDILYFLFDDDSKVKMTTWNKFNCEGNSYFDLYYKQFDEINSKKMKSIRFTNGRSFDSFTYDLTTAEQNFFIEAKKALVEKKFVPITCDK